MKAIRIHEYGDASGLRYEDAEIPNVLPNDVLIRVIAAAFNPIDAKIRQGFMKEMVPKQLPFVLGWDCAGVIEEVGANVKTFGVGDEVFTMAELARGGTYAEFVAVDAMQVALKPKALSFIEAASLPMIAQTALLAINTAELKAGQTILIHGGSGGVGSSAIQIAKALGANVITTASGGDIEYVKSLGADTAIDYKQTNFKDKVKDVDAVLDVLGGSTQEDSFAVLKRGGILISVAQFPSQEKAEHFGVRARFIFTQPNGQALSQIGKMVDDGKLRTKVGAEFPLKDARMGHDGKRFSGKIVFTVNE